MSAATHQKNSVFMVSELTETPNMVARFVEQDVRFWVQKNPKFLSRDLAMAEALAEDPQALFEDRVPYLRGEVLAQIQFQFSEPHEKQSLRDRLTVFLESVSPASTRESVEAVFEEMYMNVIYDAPREAKKMGLPVEGRRAELKISYDQEFCVMSCRDEYASMDLTKCFLRMREVYSRGVAESINLKDTGTGAGIGCVIMLEHAHTLILGHWPGKFTQVVAVIPVGLSNKARASLKKNLHRVQLNKA